MILITAQPRTSCSTRWRRFPHRDQQPVDPSAGPDAGWPCARPLLAVAGCHRNGIPRIGLLRGGV